MKRVSLYPYVCLSLLAVPACFGAIPSVTDDGKPPAAVISVVAGSVSPEPLRPELESSSAGSTAELPDAPDSPAARGAGRGTGDRLERLTSVRPFSAFAVELKLSTGGIGFDVATPLATRLNLRGGAVFLGYSPNLKEDGINVTGTVSFKTVDAHLDYFPFGGSFRISPGVTLYNGNHLNGAALVPGGSTFTLNNQDYVSSPTDPVTGSFDVKFGSKVAPSLTAGFGNILPRSGKHFSVPFEIGFEYIGAPTIALNLSGSACDPTQPAAVGCAPIATDPQTQANVKQEQDQLNSDISPLRFYPIASIGLSYKF